MTQHTHTDSHHLADNTPGRRPTGLTTTAVMAALALAVSACGATESGGEAALEQLIENETGQNIDLDLDGDGSFSLETEDGEFSINVDDEGNVVFDSDEGSGTFDSDGDGGGSFEFESDDGSGSVQIDEDGSFVATDESGEVISGQSSDDGTFTVTGEDGETIVADISEDDGSVVVQSEDGSSFESGPGIPSQWPNDIPKPEGMTEVNGTYMGDATSLNIVAAGFPPGDPIQFLESYVASLVAVGFTETATFSQEGSVTYSHDRDGVMVSSSYTDLGDTGQIVVSVSRF